MSVTQHQFPILEKALVGCGSYNLHERISGMDPEAKSSPWEAECFSLETGVKQVIEATLTIPSAWR